jgi:hypothetical protein
LIAGSAAAEVTAAAGDAAAPGEPAGLAAGLAADAAPGTAEAAAAVVGFGALAEGVVAGVAGEQARLMSR